MRRPLWRCAYTAFVLVALACAPLTTEPYNRVTVSVEGGGVVEGLIKDTLVRRGDTLRLFAIPDSGMVFAGWRYGAFSAENPLLLIVTGDKSVVACFAPRPPHMVFIPARNRSFIMGSEGPGADEYERPAHEVRFSYDFFISRTETTQGDYADLLGTIPVTGAGAQDIGDSFPVYNVTWYDAVLYCNALSKKHGYDTVYRYTGRCTDPTCPWVLENLQICYDRFGYRLPTEAEWEYACRAGTTSAWYWGDSPAADSSAVRYAWYFANASDHAQRVGRLTPNPLGLYDMAGNLAEWVNDWLEYYPDAPVTDPTGPGALLQEQYEANGERPVRGGSWRLGLSQLRSSCRKGPYRTSAFTAQKDIGFRVAIGAFNARATQRRPDGANTLPLTLSCSRTDLFRFIGTARVKFALVVKQEHRRRLAMIDPSLPGTPIRGCGTDTAVFAPAIAPNGRLVAYSSQGEGFSTPGTITVRRFDTTGGNPSVRSGYLPRFWVSPDRPDTFIVFTDGASSNTLPRWRSEKTWRIRYRDGQFIGVPEVLWNEGSFHGGISSDGRFLGTSFPVARLVDLRLNDTNIFYFITPYNGRDDNPQVCNLSMSPSLKEPGEALLLDFGYPKVSTLIGRPYGLHEFVFICTLRPSQVAQWFEKPASYAQWDFPEWSNHPDFFVAIARTAAGGDDALFVVRRSDSQYLKVATGKNLSYPTLWIDPAEVSEEENPYRWFGAYDLPVQWNGHVVQSKKLRLFWHERLRLQCVGIGSSPLHNGMDPAVMSLPSLNIAGLGSDMFTDAMIARDYVLPHTPHLRAIVLDLTPGFLNINRWQPPRYNGLYDSKGYELDARNGFYRDSLPAGVLRAIASFTAADWEGFDSTGYGLADNTGSGWGEPIIDRADFSIDDAMVQESFRELAALADSAAARKVHVLVVNFPEHPGYKNTPMIGRYGPSRQTFAHIVATIDTLCQKNPYLHFYDANMDGLHDYTSDEAQDCNHLNRKGAARLSARIDSCLAAILAR